MIFAGFIVRGLDGMRHGMSAMGCGCVRDTGDGDWVGGYSLTSGLRSQRLIGQCLRISLSCLVICFNLKRYFLRP